MKTSSETKRMTYNEAALLKLENDYKNKHIEKKIPVPYIALLHLMQ